MTTEVCGILLHPSGHTLSPVLHRAAYAALKLDAVYLAFDIPPGQLRSAVESMRGLGLRQLSISLPHKEAVLELADEVSADAQQIGAANTLTRSANQLRADNTDWLAVRTTLETCGSWQGKRALVLGAGGAARAVVFALVQMKMEVRVQNRTAARAEQLARDLGAQAGAPSDAGPPDLLVNATSVGMDPEPDATPFPTEQLNAHTTVFDTVYRPLETRLLREARARGCPTQDGLDMLVHQAVEQLRIWSGQQADPALLREAAVRALATG